MNGIAGGTPANNRSDLGPAQTDLAVTICAAHGPKLHPAGSGSYHDILARCAEVSEVRPYTSLKSTAARFYIGADRPDLAAACFANPCSPDQNGLARRGEVL